MDSREEEYQQSITAHQLHPMIEGDASSHPQGLRKPIPPKVPKQGDIADSNSGAGRPATASKPGGMLKRTIGQNSQYRKAGWKELPETHVEYDPGLTFQTISASQAQVAMEIQNFGATQENTEQDNEQRMQALASTGCAEADFENKDRVFMEELRVADIAESGPSPPHSVHSDMMDDSLERRKQKITSVLKETHHLRSKLDDGQISVPTEAVVSHLSDGASQYSDESRSSRRSRRSILSVSPRFSKDIQGNLAAIASANSRSSASGSPRSMVSAEHLHTSQQIQSTGQALETQPSFSIKQAFSVVDDTLPANVQHNESLSDEQKSMIHVIPCLTPANQLGIPAIVVDGKQFSVDNIQIPNGKSNTRNRLAADIKSVLKQLLWLLAVTSYEESVDGNHVEPIAVRKLMKHVKELLNEESIYRCFPVFAQMGRLPDDAGKLLESILVQTQNDKASDAHERNHFFRKNSSTQPESAQLVQTPHSIASVGEAGAPSPIGEAAEIFDPQHNSSIPKPIHSQETSHTLQSTMAPTSGPQLTDSFESSYHDETLYQTEEEKKKADAVIGDGIAKKIYGSRKLVEGRQIKMLLVDDDKFVRRLLQKQLSNRPHRMFEVDTAVDGHDALLKLDDFEPDIVVTDVMMPVMDGYELVERIRNTPKFSHLLTIMLTSLGSKERKSNAKVDGWLSKPLGPEKIEQLVSSLIEYSHHKTGSSSSGQFGQSPGVHITGNSGPNGKLSAQSMAGNEHNGTHLATQSGNTSPTSIASDAFGRRTTPVVSTLSTSSQDTTSTDKAKLDLAANPPNLLIVDDSIFLRKTLSKALQHPNGVFNVMTAAHGGEAFDIITQGQFVPDCVLSDVLMPVMDGFTLVRKIRSLQDPIGQVPIVMLTALNDVEERIKGFEFGANDFVLKPTKKNEVTTRILRLLDYSLGDDKLSPGTTVSPVTSPRKTNVSSFSSGSSANFSPTHASAQMAVEEGSAFTVDKFTADLTAKVKEVDKLLAALRARQT